MPFPTLTTPTLKRYAQQCLDESNPQHPFYKIQHPKRNTNTYSY